MDSTAPSKRQYLKMVLLKAWEIESGKWFATAWSTVVTLIGGIACLIAQSGRWEILAAQSDRLLMAGYGLLLLGMVNLCRCIFAAPYKMHCEQLSDAAVLRESRDLCIADRDRAIAAMNEEPLSLFDAKAHLKSLAAWLLSEFLLNPSDISSHRARSGEIYSGLLNQETPTGEYMSIADGGESRRFQWSNKDILEKMSSDIEWTAIHLKNRDFNAKWKPPG